MPSLTTRSFSIETLRETARRSLANREIQHASASNNLRIFQAQFPQAKEQKIPSVPSIGLGRALFRARDYEVVLYTVLAPNHKSQVFVLIPIYLLLQAINLAGALPLLSGTLPPSQCQYCTYCQAPQIEYSPQALLSTTTRIVVNGLVRRCVLLSHWPTRKSSTAIVRLSAQRNDE